MCRVFSYVIGRGCLLWPVHFLGKTLLVFALLHSTFHGQICLLLQVFLDFVSPWTTARQASLSITNSWSPPKPMSIESVIPSNRLILCHPLLLLPSIPPSIRVFSNESALHMRWPKYWSFSFRISVYIYAYTCTYNFLENKKRLSKTFPTNCNIHEPKFHTHLS